ncbi:MAG: TetR family transcriptional regulator [Thermaurantiacus sp.]
MARPKSPEREEAKRRGILDAAARVFQRDGLRGASIASICRAAGISAGQLYYYFPGKEALIEAMAEADLANIRHFAAQLVSLDDLLSAAVASTDVASPPDWKRAQMLGGSLAFDLHAEASRNPRLRAIVEAHYRAISELFGERLRQAQAAGEVAAGHDPVRLARMVGAVREGLLTLASAGPGMVDEAMRRDVRAMLERMARTGALDPAGAAASAR